MTLLAKLCRFRKTRNIFVCLIIFLIFYTFINQFFINSITRNEKDRYDEFKPNNDMNLAKSQIDNIKNRINKLEISINKSNLDAKDLNVLIDKAQNNLYSNVPTKVKPEIKDIQESKEFPHVDKIAVLVFSCNRPNAIRSHLDQLISNRKSIADVEKFPIIVSQDCGHAETRNTIETYKDYLYAFIKQPDLSDIIFDESKKDLPKKKIPAHMKGYFKIARHYKFALEEIFMKYKFQTVIMNEDDLNLSPDFFNYFENMHKVLSRDPSLFCVSAWNDNGKNNLIQPNELYKVYRTDFFPGLGWMMQRSLWLEMRKKWPYGFWDDWIREPENRKNRACLRPEVSRVGMSKSEAKKGVSAGQFFDQYLQLITMNNEKLDWSRINPDYLFKENYDRKFLNDVYNNTVKISFEAYKKKSPNTKYQSILITYTNKKQFLEYAKHFGIMNDFKAGVPRTAYMGIIHIYFNGETIYIGPPKEMGWATYPKGW